MAEITGPGVSAEGVRRANEAYTPIYTAVIDNDGTFVTVLDITGRGVLESVGFAVGGQRGVTMRITIDGVADTEVFPSALTVEATGTASLRCGFGFETDCKVEMHLSGAAVAQFWGVANVE